MSGFVAYTAIFGGRDTLKDPAVVTPGCRYVCFTDAPFCSDVWEIVRVGPPPDPPREARRYKLLSHHIVDAEHSLWVDGSFRIQIDVRDAVERYLASADLAVFGHPDRDCIYDEADICIELGLDDPEVIRRQIRRYQRAAVPRHAGLASTGVLLRRHSAAIAALNEMWWREVDNGSRRDQLSFNVCLLMLGIPVTTLPGNIRMNDEFRLLGHVRPAPEGEQRNAGV